MRAKPTMELADSGGGSPHGSTVRYCEHLAMVGDLARTTRLICYNLRGFRSLISRGNGGCRGMGATLRLILGAIERAEGARTVACNPWVHHPVPARAKHECYRMSYYRKSNVFGKSNATN